MSPDEGTAGSPVPRSGNEVVMRAALELAGDHDLQQILHHVVVSAAAVAGARYAALGVYDRDGRIERFVHHGVDDHTVSLIGRRPEGRGLLREVIVAGGPIRLDDLTADPRSGGFPPNHPPMRSFLGVPLSIGDRRYGNLYVTEKRGGGAFDAEDEHMVVTLAAFAAAAVESALLVSSERDRSTALARTAAAEERARADRDMLGRVIAAQEAERARVARDLHDQIGQSLTSVLLAQRLVLDSLAAPHADLADARAHAEDVRALVANALGEVRRLAFDLRPTVLDDVGLVAAVHRLAADVSARHGFPVEVVLEGLDDEARYPAEVETVVYRVVQEALTNVARHARASGAVVTVAADQGRLQAEVADDGVGFEVSAGHPPSLGLAGLVERASRVGGRVEIASAPGKGTTVTLEVPLG